VSRSAAYAKDPVATRMSARASTKVNRPITSPRYRFCGIDVQSVGPHGDESRDVGVEQAERSQSHGREQQPLQELEERDET
jgi:hypothetical protein